MKIVNRILLGLVTFQDLFFLPSYPLLWRRHLKCGSRKWKLASGIPIGCSQAQLSFTVLRHSADALESLIAVIPKGPALPEGTAPSSGTDTTQRTARPTGAVGSCPEQLLSAIPDLPGISNGFVLTCSFGVTQAIQGRDQSHFE